MIKKAFLLILSIAPIFGFCSIDLRLYEKSLYSEYGEDGVLAKLFQLVPPKNKYLVHLGAGDGSNLSSSNLLRLQDWKCLLLDRLYENSEINLQKEYLTAANINQIFQKYEVPTDLDFLLIDLHYNDFYIWKALDSTYQPSLVVVNYNGTFDATTDKVIQYRSFYAGDTTDYFGASITALNELGKSKGYTLIYVETGGAYLFFLRNDLVKDLEFLEMGNPQALFHPAVKEYSPDPKNREYISYEETK